MPSATALEPLAGYRRYAPAEMSGRARAFYANIARRRTVRDFDSAQVSREVLEHCLLAAGTAPSGANQQPWFFTVITDSSVKRKIREAAETEEREFYAERAPPEWLEALAPAWHGPKQTLSRRCACADRDLRSKIRRSR